jgi:hypothetical protein
VFGAAPSTEPNAGLRRSSGGHDALKPGALWTLRVRQTSVALTKAKEAVLTIISPPALLAPDKRVAPSASALSVRREAVDQARAACRLEGDVRR